LAGEQIDILSRTPRWLAWYMNFGLNEKVGREYRRQLTCNLIMALSAMTGVIYAIFCLLFDTALWLTSALGLLIGLQFFVVPFIFRSRPLTALVFALLFSTTAFTLQSYLAGVNSGIFLYLFLVAPVLIAMNGADRLGFLIFSTAIGVAGILTSLFIVPGPALDAAKNPAFQSAMMTFSVSFAAVLIMGFGYVSTLRAESAEDALEAEHARSEALLYNLLPTEIAARLKDEPNETIADSLPKVAILFADIVDFTPRSAQMAPEHLVDFLNRVFTDFDELAEKHGLEKIKTIGDAYMAAAGMPHPCGDPVHRVAAMAVDMLEATKALSRELDGPVEVRIGIHTGPAVAGVIGNRKLFYDVWGETVNTASRMESHGQAGRIQVTDAARQELDGEYAFDPRGPIELKGKGTVETWWLTGKATDAAKRLGLSLRSPDS
jgi:adenylate cyclase